MYEGYVTIDGDSMKLRPRTFLQKLFRPAVRFIKFRILHVDDTPQRIARGMAVGLWVAFTPLIGIQMAIALAGAILFRANKALAVMCVWLSNPLTLVPVYGPCYLIGRFLLRRIHPDVQVSQVGEQLSRIFSFSTLLTSFHSAAYWKDVAEVFGKIGLEVSIGCFILGTLFAIVGYFGTYWIVTNHRAKSGRRRFRLKS
jgi:uncharacterized protein (DUF2062 family)